MTTEHELIKKAKANICLQHPFFASLLLRRPITESTDVPTLAVDNAGRIYYNRQFIEQQTVPQLIWALCHEVMHYASMHSIRKGSRNHMVWNLAGDAWINSTLGDMKVGTPIPGCVNTTGGMIQLADAENRTVEDIYSELLEKLKDQMKQSGQGKGGQGGDQSGNMGGALGEDMQDSGQPLTEGEISEIEARVRQEVAAAAQTARMYGKLGGKLADWVADIIESKIPWYDKLERFMTDRVKNDYSWARPNRRYTDYLPSMDGVGAMGEIVCQVDISGSISKAEIDHYNGHLKRLVEQCRPRKVHVLYTDTSVQRHDEFESLEDVEIRFYSGGGTDMRAGFDYIAKHGIEPEVFVTLTDGYTPWPESTDVPAIWCISSKEVAPCGESIHFSLDD